MFGCHTTLYFTFSKRRFVDLFVLRDDSASLSDPLAGASLLNQCDGRGPGAAAGTGRQPAAAVGPPQACACDTGACACADGWAGADCADPAPPSPPSAGSASLSAGASIAVAAAVLAAAAVAAVAAVPALRARVAALAGSMAGRDDIVRLRARARGRTASSQARLSDLRYATLAEATTSASAYGSLQ